MSPAGRPAQKISIIAGREAGAKQPRIALCSWAKLESPSTQPLIYNFKSRMKRWNHNNHKNHNHRNHYRNNKIPNGPNSP